MQLRSQRGRRRAVPAHRPLGQGGMGSVWLATHPALDIPCAVKFIDGEVAQLAEAQPRFEREAKAAAQLRSPHVVQILDHGVCEGTPYIAMELLDGEDLGKRLAAHRAACPPNERAAASSRRSAARSPRRTPRASSTATSSPTTSSSCRDDDREIAKVLDFGIAKAPAPAHRRQQHQDRRDARNALLHEPGAGAGHQGGRPPQRPLVARRHRLPGAHRASCPFESEALGDLLVQIIVAPVPRCRRSSCRTCRPRSSAGGRGRRSAIRPRASRAAPRVRRLARNRLRSLAGPLGRGRRCGPMAMSDPGTGNFPAAVPPRDDAAPVVREHRRSLGVRQSVVREHAEPRLRQHARNRGYGGTQALSGMGPTTGASMSRTFDGPAGAPPKGKGALVAIGGAALVALALGVLGLSFVMKSRMRRRRRSAAPRRRRPRRSCAAGRGRHRGSRAALAPRRPRWRRRGACGRPTVAPDGVRVEPRSPRTRPRRRSPPAPPRGPAEEGQGSTSGI